MTLRIYGSCAARDHEAVLLLGCSGCGKSDLLLRLIDRGYSLVADDQVLIEDGCAAPAPGLEGLVEMRGLGILRLPYRAPIKLALVCVLNERPARLPEPSVYRLEDLALPSLELDAAPASAPILIDHALDCMHGRTGMHSGAFVR